MEDRRLDYPICPYCGYHLVGFCPPDGDVKKATLYCESGECRGRSLHGNAGGYDIAFTDLKNTYERRVTRRNVIGALMFRVALLFLR